MKQQQRSCSEDKSGTAKTIWEQRRHWQWWGRVTQERGRKLSVIDPRLKERSGKNDGKQRWKPLECWKREDLFSLVLFTGSSFKFPQMAAFTERGFIAFFHPYKLPLPSFMCGNYTIAAASAAAWPKEGSSWLHVKVDCKLAAGWMTTVITFLRSNHQKT